MADAPASPLQEPMRKTSFERTLGPITVGGLRQSIMTLMQTALGGGVLTLAYAMRLSGVGFGLLLLAALALVAFCGIDVLMRGAVTMGTYDTTSLLMKCIGSSGSACMDLFLVLYGLGTMIAYLILLGDFLPSIIEYFCFEVWSTALSVPYGVLRTRCIVGTSVIIVPLSIPKKLSGLRYVTPISLIAIVVTAATIVGHCPDLHMEHRGRPEFGEVKWTMAGGWGIFQAFSIFLFAYNCHLNVVPVAAEFQRPSDARIGKVSMRVSVFLLLFYTMIAVAGYLSFADLTAQNILQNYAYSSLIVATQLMFSFTLIVGIATYVNPTLKALQALIAALVLPEPASKEPLLLDSALADDTPTAHSRHSAVLESDRLRFCLTAALLSVALVVAISVPNVADFMGFLGASVGTGLMMILPLLVLFRAPPANFSQTRTLLTAAILMGATAMAYASICVLLLQKFGVLPA